MNDVLEKIKKELKSGEVIENIDITSYDENEEVVINKPRNRKMKGSFVKKGALALALALSLSGPYNSKTKDNIAVVEAAKKDTKKPKITMKGKTKVTVDQNKKVKLGKVTAKDNVDGNVTSKIAVTVKKGKKNYKSIATKVKNNKSIKFSDSGNYVVTYTVKDSSGNKATKKRYITVKPITKVITTEVKTPEITEEEKITIPSTEIITDTKTTEESTTRITTENKTTEKQLDITETPIEIKPDTTTEEITTEEVTKMNLSDYGVLEKINVNGIEYNILNIDYSKQNYKDITSAEQSGEATCDKILVSDFGYDGSVIDYNKDHKYLEYFGNIYVKDEYGIDCSDKIFIIESHSFKYFYYVDSKGEFKLILFCSMVSYNFAINQGYFNYIDSEKKVCINGEIYDDSLISENYKKMKYVNM